MKTLIQTIAVVALMTFGCSCAADLSPEEEQMLRTVELAAEGMPKQVLCAQIQREWLCDHAGCTWSWSGCTETAQAGGDDAIVDSSRGPVAPIVVKSAP